MPTPKIEIKLGDTDGLIVIFSLDITTIRFVSLRRGIIIRGKRKGGNNQRPSIFLAARWSTFLQLIQRKNSTSLCPHCRFISQINSNVRDEELDFDFCDDRKDIACSVLRQQDFDSRGMPASEFCDFCGAFHATNLHCQNG